MKSVLGTLVILWLAACAITAQAQDIATLRGFVTDAADGQPLIGAHVVLVAQDSPLFGAISDGDGFYTIARVPVGLRHQCRYQEDSRE